MPPRREKMPRVALRYLVEKLPKQLQRQAIEIKKPPSNTVCSLFAPLRLARGSLTGRFYTPKRKPALKQIRCSPSAIIANHRAANFRLL